MGINMCVGGASLNNVLLRASLVVREQHGTGLSMLVDRESISVGIVDIDSSAPGQAVDQPARALNHHVAWMGPFAAFAAVVRRR